MKQDDDWKYYPKERPTQGGQYLVDTNNGKTLAFWCKKASGEWHWMCPNEQYRVKSFLQL